MSLDSLLIIVIIGIGIVAVMVIAWFIFTMYLQINDHSDTHIEVDNTPYLHNTPATTQSDPAPPQSPVASGTSVIKRADLEQRMRDSAPKADAADEPAPKQSGNPIQWPRINKPQKTSEETGTSKVPTRVKKKSDTGDLRPPSKPARKNKWTGLGSDWDE